MVKKHLNVLLVTKMLKNLPSCIFLTKMASYRKDFDETEYISFLMKDGKLLEKIQ